MQLLLAYSSVRLQSSAESFAVRIVMLLPLLQTCGLWTCCL